MCVCVYVYVCVCVCIGNVIVFYFIKTYSNIH